MDNLQNVRLECLKIAALRAPSPQEVVGQAKMFEDYILGTKADAKIETEEPPKEEPKSHPGKKKKTGNLDSLI